ncbi:unnamed protein product [Effrenium voratum]|nr:unnamed protein product [Effrenium voratum]
MSAGSDIELPPSILPSDDGSDESAVELPDQILAAEPCCAKKSSNGIAMIYACVAIALSVIVPADGRKAPLKKAEPKTDDVDAFFCFIYDNLWHQWQDFLNTASLAITALKSGEKPSIQKLWLPTMTPSEIFDLYKDMHCDHQELARSTFVRVWTRWQAILGIRPPQVHSRCDDCAKYSKFRRLQTSAADSQAVTLAYNKHIREVFADRGILTSSETMAEQAARNDDLQLPHLVLTIDAMDKSKWQVLLLESLSTLLSWRPM